MNKIVMDFKLIEDIFNVKNDIRNYEQEALDQLIKFANNEFKFDDYQDMLSTLRIVNDYGLRSNELTEEERNLINTLTHEHINALEEILEMFSL